MPNEPQMLVGLGGELPHEHKGRRLGHHDHDAKGGDSGSDEAVIDPRPVNI